MDIETAGRYGNKRVHQRVGSSAAAAAVPDRVNKVCYHWRAGRCNRHPCPFLHSELPAQPDGVAAKRAHHQALAWRNPSSGGGNSGPTSKWGKGRGGGAAGRPPAKVPDKVCNYFLAGNCTFGESCRFLHSWFISDSFSLLTPLQGHQKVAFFTSLCSLFLLHVLLAGTFGGFWWFDRKELSWKAVAGIALPSGSEKLYSGSQDESVRVWDCRTGQCVGIINLGDQIGCMISEGPWVFIGIPSAVKAWNTQTATDLSLSGPAGQVYALVVGNEMLFAGTQGGCILAWKFSAVGNCFEPTASLSGHQLAVVSLAVGAMRLYSGSMDHTIKVWDLATLQCIQTLTDHTSVVMSVLCWDQFLLSCSLDQTIKVWVATESGNLELIMKNMECLHFVVCTMLKQNHCYYVHAMTTASASMTCHRSTRGVKSSPRRK